MLFVKKEKRFIWALFRYDFEFRGSFLFKSLLLVRIKIKIPKSVSWGKVVCSFVYASWKLLFIVFIRVELLREKNNGKSTEIVYTNVDFIDFRSFVWI